MKILDYILNKLEDEKMHMGLIDPDEQEPIDAGYIASSLENVGSDAVMVGGSTGVNREKLEATVSEIKSSVSIPVIQFPTSASAISKNVDAIYFMSMLNSRDRKKIIGEQVKGAPFIKKMGIEPISMAYLIVEPGMTVGKVGQADLIPKDDPDIAVSYSLAAQYLGMKLLYLEAGSGAPEPVPAGMIKKVKENVDMPIIVGGGIRTPEQAYDIVQAGADIIVTGTVIEESHNIESKLEGLISKIKR